MVQFLEEIPASLGKWMDQQQVFWVATSPLSAEGRVNVSPKGGEGTPILNSSQKHPRKLNAHLAYI